MNKNNQPSVIAENNEYVITEIYYEEGGWLSSGKWRCKYVKRDPRTGRLSSSTSSKDLNESVKSFSIGGAKFRVIWPR